MVPHVAEPSAVGFELLNELGPAAMNADFDRWDSDAENPGDLGVLQAFEKAEDDNGLLPDRQVVDVFPKATIHFVLDHGRFRRSCLLIGTGLYFVGLRIRSIGGEEAGRPAADLVFEGGLPQAIDGGVGRDPVDPRRDLGSAFKLAQPPTDL